MASNIFAQFAQPQRGVLDYMDQMDAADARRQQNALSSMALQHGADKTAADRAARARSDEVNNAFRRIAAGWTADTSPDQRAADLMNSGLGELSDRADAILKAATERAKGVAAAKKDTADAEKARAAVLDETIKRYRGHLAYIDSPQAAARWTQAQYADPVVGPHVQALATLQDSIASIPTDPAEFQKWRSRAALGMEKWLADQRASEEAAQKARNDLVGPDGRPNQPVIAAKKAIAKEGASKIDMKIDAKLGEGVAAQVGPMMRESYESAGGAQQSIATASQLIKAVDSGKVFAGPGASLKLKAAQLGQMLGLGGENLETQIANTRAAIQGLAQSTVAARSALKGQGQVSDYEGRLLARAASGDIDELTGPEIKQIALANQRLSQKLIDQHSDRIKRLRSNKSTAELADFYELTPSGAQPAEPSAKPPASSPSVSNW